MPVCMGGVIFKQQAKLRNYIELLGAKKRQTMSKNFLFFPFANLPSLSRLATSRGGGMVGRKQGKNGEWGVGEKERIGKAP